MSKLKKLSYKLRKNTVDIIMAGGTGHIGGDMSVMDILVELYFNQMNISPENVNAPNRDRFVLSKGHSMEAYYAVLAEKGFLNLDEIKEKFSRFGTQFIGHPNNKLNGIEMNSGSLGHGLPVCVGMALAGKMNNQDYRVYTVMGDGELAEGSVWEGFMAGGHYQLSNLCAIIDRNGLQISGTTEEIMSHKALKDRISSFGWNVIEIDGHNYDELSNAFELAKNEHSMPTAIIANTIKGYGSAVMENKKDWHHRVPTAEEYERIISDFKEREAECDE